MKCPLHLRVSISMIHWPMLEMKQKPKRVFTPEQRARRNELAKKRYEANEATRKRYQEKARARIPEKCEYEKRRRRKEAAEEGRLLGKRKPTSVLAEELILESYRKESATIARQERGLFWWKEKRVLNGVTAMRLSKAWYALSPEEKRQKSKEKSALRTPEQQAEYNRRYWEKLKGDPERKKELTRRWSKAARMAMKPHHKAKENLRNRFRKRLKQFNTTKSDSFSNMLGCKWSFFTAWVEKKWAKGMSWDNYGSEWHIDHIEPLAVFDAQDKEQMKRAWHYTNLRPLWARENRDKRDSIITHQPELTLCLPPPR